ncbi:MAG: hemerythrin domain-containing protein [Acidobacteriaceae bacterium]
MAVQIGAKPDSGFDDPIGMLKDCHRRIERFLNVLCRVAERAQGRSLTEEERAAIEAALFYFQHAGRRHTADEEESLFPRLHATLPAESAAGADIRTNMDLSAGMDMDIERLQSDHGRANQLHASIDELYMAWISAGSLPMDQEQLLLSSTRALQQLYAEHLIVEEQFVFPRAAASLDQKTLAAIGLEFKARRSDLARR